jgi:hypothetical protein
MEWVVRDVHSVRSLSAPLLPPLTTRRTLGLASSEMRGRDSLGCQVLFISIDVLDSERFEDGRRGLEDVDEDIMKSV